MRVANIVLSSLLIAASLSASESALPNPGFEEGLTAWAVKDQMSGVSPEAAHSGKLGLRIKDDDASSGSSVMSAKLPVKPKQRVHLNFWARTKESFSSVYLWFYDDKGRVVKDAALKSGDGLASAAITNADGDWHTYDIDGIAPDGAASVSVWIHTYSTSKGSVDLDDFVLSGIEADAKPVIPAAEKVVDISKLPPRTKPPVIVIKVDDLRQVNGRVPLLWVRFADAIKQRGIKASIGIICQTLEEATPEYAGWIKEQQASGRIEFWFHGYTHDVRKENGKDFGEFVGRDYDEQKRRFDLSEALAKDKLGFALQTFGPPGGAAPSFDKTTVKVMADVPDMKVWLYPTPIDEPGKKLAAEGKVVILDRVFEVNLESAVGQPSYSRFITGYAKHPDREYFVLQGHTAQWGAPGRFDEALKIIDFLISQHARFVTPMELAEELRTARK